MKGKFSFEVCVYCSCRQVRGRGADGSAAPRRVPAGETVRRPGVDPGSGRLTLVHICLRSPASPARPELRRVLKKRVRLHNSCIAKLRFY